jgi:hypothetical protein
MKLTELFLHKKGWKINNQKIKDLIVIESIFRNLFYTGKGLENNSE